MPTKGIPDAWDDDYESLADSQPSAPLPPAPSTPMPSRAQRKAQHAAANKALWDSAENPEANSTHFFLQKNDVPLKSQAKPKLQVLSRKPKEEKSPAPRRNPNGTTGLEDGVDDVRLEDEELDSEDEARRESERKLRQRQEQARVEREEKLKKYDETRRRIFGGSEENNSSTKGTVNGGTRSPNGRQRAGGGGGAGSRGGARGGSRSDSRPASSAGQSPARGVAAQSKALFDPVYSAKPGSGFAHKGTVQIPSESQHIRQPRAPDGSGRGGFGFAPRGGGASVI